MKTGDTFFFNHAVSHHHLWIVAGGPTPGDEFAIFNITTVQAGCDKTCILTVSDHPLIIHPSYVTYLRGRPLPGEWEVSYGHLFSWQQPVSPPVLLRVQAGALASRFTPQYLQEIVRLHP